MNLHDEKKLFKQTLKAASQYLNINIEFVEKDYWITLLLHRLAKSEYANITVFKGGTSLSKGYRLIDRFSEDVDLAIISTAERTGNETKNLIRNIEKHITQGLTEVKEENLISKGTRFRKSLYTYPPVLSKNNRIVLEINSFANPFPYETLYINSFVYDFLSNTQNDAFIKNYGLEPFSLKVLCKKQTLLEKLVSLIRFSLAEDSTVSVSTKIRHFYDIYHLVNDADCNEFIKSDNFIQGFYSFWKHDQEIFDEPAGWREKNVLDSPLLGDFDALWNKLKNRYKTELAALAYRDIPNEKQVAEALKQIIELLRSGGNKILS